MALVGYNEYTQVWAVAGAVQRVHPHRAGLTREQKYRRRRTFIFSRVALCSWEMVQSVCRVLADGLAAMNGRRCACCPDPGSGQCWAAEC